MTFLNRHFHAVLIACLSGANLTAWAQPVAEPVAPEPNAPLPAEAVIVDEESGIQQITITSPGAEKFKRGREYFEAKNYAEAIKTFTSLVKKYPNDRRREQALYYIAESYRLAGKQGDAVRAFIYLTKQYPDSLLVPVSYLRVGDAYYQARQFENAIPFLLRAAQAEEQAVAIPANYLLAVCRLQSGKPDQVTWAREQLQDTIQRGEKDPKWAAYAGAATQALAVNYDNAGESKLARHYWLKLRSLTKKDDTKALAAARAGWNAMRLGQRTEAEQLFGATLKLAPKSDWVRIANTGLLKVYYQTEQHAKLLQLIARAENRFLPNHESEILFAQGNALFRSGKYGESIRTLETYLKSFPQEQAAPVAAYLKLIATAQVEPKELALETESFLKDYPKSEYALKVKLLRAQELQRTGRYAEALVYWNTLYSARKSAEASELPQSEILFEKARAEYELKQWTPAAGSYTEFVRQNARDKRALDCAVRAAVAYEQAQKTEEALEAWDRVLTMAPAKSEQRQIALERSGSLALQNGKDERMAKAFVSLLREYPQTKLANLAAYWVGSLAFDEKAYRRAEEYLLLSRIGDGGREWMLSATERLALLSYLEQDVVKTLKYSLEFERQAAMEAGEDDPRRLPVELYFWLGLAQRKAGNFKEAAVSFANVLRHPDNEEYKIAAAWERAESQRLAGDFGGAVLSYERYLKLNEDLSESNQVLFALAKAYRGARDYERARETIEKLLKLNVEGEENARARLLLGDVYFDEKNFEQASAVFGVLALAFDDPEITPRAMLRTAESFEKLGKPQDAAKWRRNLLEAYPDYVTE